MTIGHRKTGMFGGNSCTANLKASKAGLINQRCRITANRTLKGRAFKQKMNYADKIGVPFVLILGDNEIADGTVGCKNMVSGEQITVSPAEAIAHIKAALAEQEKGAIILEK